MPKCAMISKGASISTRTRQKMHIVMGTVGLTLVLMLNHLVMIGRIEGLNFLFLSNRMKPTGNEAKESMGEVGCVY